MRTPDRLSPLWLAIRSIVWAAVLPGMVAGYIPWRFLGVTGAHVRWRDPLDVLSILLIGLGAAVLGACIWDFAARGQGTLSPADPPRELVVHGLYRYVRNPMYLSVTTILVGEILLTRSTGLLTYWAIWFLGVNLFVIGFEEPTLRRQFGASYERYAATVPRWLPTLGRRRRSSCSRS
jgi:protein-S-isoprenylcysteine O-methyltransferase Ste14